LEVDGRKITADKILIARGASLQTKFTRHGICHYFQSNVSPAQATEAHCHYWRWLYCGEFANIMNGLGSEVTQIIRKDRILQGSMTTSALGFRMA